MQRMLYLCAVIWNNVDQYEMRMTNMKRIVTIISIVCTLACGTASAQTAVQRETPNGTPVMLQRDTVLEPGVEYLLLNAGSGLFLMTNGTMVADPMQADSWRVLDSVSPTYIHSNRIFLFMSNGGFTGWKVNLSGEAGSQEIISSTTTPGAFKLRCKYMLDTRYLNVQQSDTTLSCAQTQGEWNDWFFVRAPRQNLHLYRILTARTANGNTKFTIGYQSVDIEGNPVELSGYLAIPTSSKGGMCTADHILFSTHYTMTKNTEVPSIADPFDALTFTMSGNKPVMIEPDYLGYGLTVDKPHPYLAPDIMARNCVDMLLACHQLLREMTGFDVSQGNIPTYGIGYSQGGSIILAVQKYIETSPNLTDSVRNVIRYVRTCAGAGPYNPLATLSQYMYQDDLSMPCAAPLLLSGVIEAYPQIFDTIRAEDYFSDAFNNADILGMMRSCNYTIDELNAAIKSACGANKMSLMLSEQAKDMNSDIMQKLHKALGQCNLTRDWVPQADIWFFHNGSDDVVPYLNTMSAYNAFVNTAAGSVSLYTTGIGMSHTAAAVDFMARMILGNYK